MEIENIRAEVFQQYEEVRKSGLTNMFDLSKVTKIAEDMDYTALLEEIDEGNYGRILRNYSKAVKIGIIQK
jgi:Mg/Co/Ni transporter MgtE